MSMHLPHSPQCSPSNYYVLETAARIFHHKCSNNIPPHTFCLYLLLQTYPGLACAPAMTEVYPSTPTLYHVFISTCCLACMHTHRHTDTHRHGQTKTDRHTDARAHSRSHVNTHARTRPPPPPPRPPMHT